MCITLNFVNSLLSKYHPLLSLHNWALIRFFTFLSSQFASINILCHIQSQCNIHCHRNVSISIADGWLFIHISIACDVTLNIYYSRHYICQKLLWNVILSKTIDKRHTICIHELISTSLIDKTVNNFILFFFSVCMCVSYVFWHVIFLLFVLQAHSGSMVTRLGRDALAHIR